MKRAAWIMAGLAALCAVAWAADELKVTLGWQYSKGGRARLLTVSATEYDVSGSAVIENVQSIATNAAGEALALGDVTTPGFAYFKNLDATNYVEVGFDDSGFVPFLRLYPGEAAACWLAVAAPYACAYTNAVLLDYVIVQR